MDVKGSSNRKLFVVKTAEAYTLDPKAVPGNAIEAGNVYLAFSKKSPCLVRVLGFCKEHDDKHILYKSVKEAYKALNVKSLEALREAIDVHMVCEDVGDPAERGGWFYVYNKRWAMGSSADALTFYLAEKA